MIYGHDRFSYLIIGSMKTDSKWSLSKILRKSFDTRNDTTSRNRNSSICDIKLFLVRKHLDRELHHVIVEHRFPHPHKDDISKFFSFAIEQMWSKHHLLDDLIEWKIFLKSKLPGSTKSTSHRTSCLAADTQSISPREMTHQNWLDKKSILRLKKKLCSLTIAWCCLVIYRKWLKKTMLWKEFSKFFWYGLNFVKVWNEILIDCIFYLTIAKSWNLMCAQKFLHLSLIMYGKTWHCNVFRLRLGDCIEKIYFVKRKIIQRILWFYNYFLYWDYIFNIFPPCTTKMQVPSSKQWWYFWLLRVESWGYIFWWIPLKNSQTQPEIVLKPYKSHVMVSKRWPIFVTPTGYFMEQILQIVGMLWIIAEAVLEVLESVQIFV